MSTRELWEAARIRTEQDERAQAYVFIKAVLQQMYVQRVSFVEFEMTSDYWAALRGLRKMNGVWTYRLRQYNTKNKPVILQTSRRGTYNEMRPGPTHFTISINPEA